MTVYLVGAGPGDPGLITVRGRDLVERCDAIVYDRLADPRIVELAPDTADRVYAGKRPGEHAMTQEAPERAPRRARRPSRDRRSPEGRRPVRVWPRWRGGARTRGGRDRLRDRPRRELGARRPRVCRHPGDAARRRGTGHLRHRARGSDPARERHRLGLAGGDARDARLPDGRRRARGERPPADRPRHARRHSGGRHLARHAAGPAHGHRAPCAHRRGGRVAPRPGDHGGRRRRPHARPPRRGSSTGPFTDGGSS